MVSCILKVTLCNILPARITKHTTTTAPPLLTSRHVVVPLSPTHLEFLLVQQHVVSLQVRVLLPLVAQLPLCRGEQTLHPLEVLLQLPGLLRLLAQDRVLRLGGRGRQGGSVG